MTEPPTNTTSNSTESAPSSSVNLTIVNQATSGNSLDASSNTTAAVVSAPSETTNNEVSGLNSLNVAVPPNGPNGPNGQNGPNGPTDVNGYPLNGMPYYPVPSAN